MPTKNITTNIKNPGRRDALKKIAVGGTVVGLLGVSGKWTKPVIDSVVLPAHAQATNASLFTVYSTDKKKSATTTTAP